NPFYRTKRAPIVTGPFDFNDAKQVQPLMALKATLTDAAIAQDAAAFIGFLDKQKQTNRAKGAGVQGYCFSGPFAFQTGAVRSGRVPPAAALPRGALGPDPRGRDVPWRWARHQGGRQPAPADPQDPGELRRRHRPQRRPTATRREGRT